MKDLTAFPLKEIEDTFNKEMWREKTGVRMKYRGINNHNRAVFDIHPLDSLGIVISDFTLSEEIEYAIKELFKVYDLEIDLWSYPEEDNKITLYIQPKK